MIKVKNLTKYFWKNKVLNNISFEIKSGEICGFVWENWAWKSTTMKIIATEILDYEWEIFINKKNISSDIENVRKMIWFMPDQYWLYDDITLREYLTFNMLLYKIKDSEKLIEQILEKVYLIDKIDDKISNLSRWMTQRICLARALITSPKLLILDEPASWLDPKLRIELKNILLNLKKEWITIFVSSHILSELWEYCDQIIFINKWQIVKEWNLNEMKTDNNKNSIIINTSDNKKCYNLLLSQKFIEKVEIENSKLLISLKKQEDTNKILKLLLKEKIDLIELNKDISSLEEIYMKIVK